MQVKYQEFQITPNSDIFKIICKVIKNPLFDYNKDNPIIDKEIRIQNKYHFRVRVEWYDEICSGFDIWKVINDDSK